jgi:hypothetical protein
MKLERLLTNLISARAHMLDQRLERQLSQILKITFKGQETLDSWPGMYYLVGAGPRRVA